METQTDSNTELANGTASDHAEKPHAENLRWYTLQTRTNYEKRVISDLTARIEREGLEDQFGEILMPVQRIVEMKNGQKRETERKLMPNYLFVQIATEPDGAFTQISSEAWHTVKDTTNVIGFIGTYSGRNDRPMPTDDAQVEKFLRKAVRKGKEQAGGVPTVVIANLFEKGDDVRITDGPFNDFNGVVSSYDPQRGTVKVDVLVFGRTTPVEFEVTTVEKTS